MMYHQIIDACPLWLGWSAPTAGVPSVERVEANEWAHCNLPLGAEAVGTLFYAGPESARC